ncbi:MAG: hypothetical protein R6W93_09775, partial [Candidatus Limnocylindrales bacterium]
PARPVRIGDQDRAGWWLIDPLSGRAVDQMDDGRGEAVPGYLTIEYGNFRASIPIRRMAICAAWVAVLAVNILSVYGGIYIAATYGGSLARGLAASAAAGAGVGALNAYNAARSAGCG